MKDYYYILGINEKSTHDEIKRAYRKLSHKFHPDKNEGDIFFEERFKDIKEAYETLIDSIKRKHYDLNRNSYYSNKKSNNSKEERKEEAPQIVIFSVDKENISENEIVTLTWNVLNADKIEIQNIATNLDSVGTKSIIVKNLKDKEFTDIKLIAANSRLSVKAIKSVRINNKFFNEKAQGKRSQNKSDTENNYQNEKPNSKEPNHSKVENKGRLGKLFLKTLITLMIPIIIYFCYTTYIKYSLQQAFDKETQLLTQEKSFLQFPIPSLGILFNEVKTKYENENIYIKFKINLTTGDKDIQNIIATKLQENKYSFNFNFKDKSDFILESHSFNAIDLVYIVDEKSKIIGFDLNEHFGFDREKYKAFTNYEINYIGTGIDINEIIKDENEKIFGKPIEDKNYLGKIHIIPTIVKDSVSLDDRMIGYTKIDFPDPEDIGGGFNLRNLRPEEFIEHNLVLTTDFANKYNFSLLKIDFNGDKINDFCTVLLNKLNNKCGFYLFLSESKDLYKVIFLEENEHNERAKEQFGSSTNIQFSIQVGMDKIKNTIEFSSNRPRNPLSIAFDGILMFMHESSNIWVFYFKQEDSTIRLIDIGA